MVIFQMSTTGVEVLEVNTSKIDALEETLKKINETDLSSFKQMVFKHLFAQEGMERGGITSSDEEGKDNTADILKEGKLFTELLKKVNSDLVDSELQKCQDALSDDYTKDEV